MSLPPVPPGASTSSSADAERDAWLSEALRHAPDADVAPPAALSDVILREAQAKAKPRAPLAKRPSFWMRAWVWTAQPAVGAGLASVMVASLVGVMLWDRPPEENTPRSLPKVAVAPAPVAAPAQKEAPAAPMAEQAKQTPPSTVASDTSATAGNMARGLEQGQTEKSRRDSGTDAKQLAESRPRREAPAAQVPNPPVESSMKEMAENKPADSAAHPDAFAKAARKAEAMSPAAPAVKAIPAPIHAPAPAVAAPPPAEPAATVPPAQMAEPAPAAPRPTASLKRDSYAAAASMQDRLASAAAGALSAASAETEFDELRAGLAAEPGNWVWQRNGGQVHVVDDDLSAFLAEVDAVAASGWQRPGSKRLASRASEPGSLQSERANTTANPLLVPPQTVRLMRDGKVTHTLRLDADTLRWEHVTPNTRVVTEIVLDEAQAHRIRRALDKLRG
ncbi:MAG: hypothetical protein JF606_05330 [Burkholderiales bacterium]|nr:hypothetical protein [Burkholderiales bacterium]